jgi:hypothetical protein
MWAGTRAELKSGRFETEELAARKVVIEFEEGEGIVA